METMWRLEQNMEGRPGGKSLPFHASWREQGREREGAETGGGGQRQREENVPLLLKCENETVIMLHVPRSPL